MKLLLLSENTKFIKANEFFLNKKVGKLQKKLLSTKDLIIYFQETKKSNHYL